MFRSITNLNIKVDNKEIPALDGSGKLFLKYVKSAGKIVQDKQLKTINLKQPIGVIQTDKLIIATPCDRLKITYGIDSC